MVAFSKRDLLLPLANHNAYDFLLWAISLNYFNMLWIIFYPTMFHNLTQTCFLWIAAFQYCYSVLSLNYHYSGIPITRECLQTKNSGSSACSDYISSKEKCEQGDHCYLVPTCLIEPLLWKLMVTLMPINTMQTAPLVLKGRKKGLPSYSHGKKDIYPNKISTMEMGSLWHSKTFL